MEKRRCREAVLGASDQKSHMGLFFISPMRKHKTKSPSDSVSAWDLRPWLCRFIGYIHYCQLVLCTSSFKLLIHINKQCGTGPAGIIQITNVFFFFFLCFHRIQYAPHLGSRVPLEVNNTSWCWFWEVGMLSVVHFSYFKPGKEHWLWNCSSIMALYLYR